MKRLSILLLVVLVLISGIISVQAAEVLPESGIISITGYSSTIWLTDINVGSTNTIYLTEKSFGSTMLVNPITLEYKIYGFDVSGDKGDVQPAPDGRIWYTDNVEYLGVFDPTGCSNVGDPCPGKAWRFPKIGIDSDQINIGPITFDNHGRVWVGDMASSINRLYRVAQISENNLEYCSFDIGFYRTQDIKFYNDALWFGDYKYHRILRFEPDPVLTSGTLTGWQLDSTAIPYGLVFDAYGTLWWVETSGKIGHLTFGTNGRLTYYTIPVNSYPKWISIQNGIIWYSDEDGRIGQLDPTIATPTSSLPNQEMQLNDPSVTCENLASYNMSATFMETKPLTFTVFSPALVPDTSNPGWTIYTLPTGSKPAGMAAVGNQVYVADSNISTVNTGKLVRFTIPEGQYKVFLPLILR